MQNLAQEAIRQCLAKYGVRGATDLAPCILSDLYRYGFFVVFESKCWCEGKNTGTEHTPGCAGIRQEENLRSLTSETTH